MNEGGPASKRKPYPRSAANLIWNNRFTTLGACLMGAGMVAPDIKGGDVSEYVAFMVNHGISPMGGLLLGLTQFGAGTVGAYKRTIDTYKRFGKIPTRYEGKYEGWYCQERGFKLAVKDIKKGKV